ncbi:unnamed protein product [Penicillium salamii]|uniref:Uncharacterized protein n=1 Tax=Penicillium salamii TaxID=1612424 RepID=A0A9W4JIZ5_9EURO|nr:unnamed protein product [Penicillium salamii]
MADPLSLAGSALGLFQFFVTSRFIYPAWEVVTLHRLRKNYSSLSQKFGGLQALLLMAIFPDGRQIVDRVERYVLRAKTDEPLVLRKSTSQDCTMLAVAAAVVAQVAITALSLTDLDQVHWTAKAAFVLSLTCGGLSVFYACLVQQRMSGLFTTARHQRMIELETTIKQFKSRNRWKSASFHSILMIKAPTL